MPKSIQKVRFSFEETGLTHFGGMWLIQSFCKLLGLRQRLYDYVRRPQRNHFYSSTEFILALLYSIIMGLRRINKTDIRFGLYGYSHLRGAAERGCWIQSEEARTEVLSSASMFRGKFSGILARQSSSWEHSGHDRSDTVHSAVSGESFFHDITEPDTVSYGLWFLFQPHHQLSGRAGMRLCHCRQGIRDHQSAMRTHAGSKSSAMGGRPENSGRKFGMWTRKSAVSLWCDVPFLPTRRRTGN